MLRRVRFSVYLVTIRQCRRYHKVTARYDNAWSNAWSAGLSLDHKTKNWRLASLPGQTNILNFDRICRAYTIIYLKISTDLELAQKRHE